MAGGHCAARLPGHKLMGAASSQRYNVSDRARRADRLMARVISFGGVGIIVAVLAIFVFILAQVVPLFRRAELDPDKTWEVPAGHYVALDADENGLRPFLITRQGDVRFLDAATGQWTEQHLPLPNSEKSTALSYHSAEQRIVVGTDQGRVYEASVRPFVNIDSPSPAGVPEIKLLGSAPLGPPDARVLTVDVNGSVEQRLGLGVLSVSNTVQVKAILWRKKRSLAGRGEWKRVREWDLTEHWPSPPIRFLVNRRGLSAVAVQPDGQMAYLTLDRENLQVVQRWNPLADASQAELTLADYILGDESMVLGRSDGALVGYSLYSQGPSGRRWGPVRSFSPMPSPVCSYSKSHRNKSFLIGAGRQLAVFHFTTGDLRAQRPWPHDIHLVALGKKQNMLWVLDEASRLHRLRLHDPHPEAGWRAFFGKIQYEGSPEPRYEWQSTGGADEFEPKLSMVPLIFGTLKGTLYAMLFSIPLALVAALYTSQFAHPNVRRYIKPTLELMASLPSVILGFLAALWLAPLLEHRVPSLLAAMAAIPLAAIVFGLLWQILPRARKGRIPEGYEFVLLAPVLLAAFYLAWKLGFLLERKLFTITDPQTGLTTTGLKAWWTQVVGLPYEQRNALVVGIMMGFAVIPIIFTVAEDALSNVPQSIRSASLALGASRWQTALRVVFPSASAGIFSAIMLGFGRAIGETMIVLMATGNTPIMSMNIFSGMRTLSANIAVEIPEAPHHSTLYRALFLSGLLLFISTFVINTLADLLRHRLREQYKQ